MRSDSVFTTIFEVIVVILFCVAFAYCINGAINAAKSGDVVSQRCIDAGYSTYRVSEGRVYCLDFGAEPRIMRLEAEE